MAILDRQELEQAIRKGIERNNPRVLEELKGSPYLEKQIQTQAQVLVEDYQKRLLEKLDEEIDDLEESLESESWKPEYKREIQNNLTSKRKMLTQTQGKNPQNWPKDQDVWDQLLEAAMYDPDEIWEEMEETMENGGAFLNWADKNLK